MAAVENRRDALLEAMIRVVGREGYADASVADVIAEADTSRTTFYKHFADKQECFLAAYEALVDRLLATVTAECGNDRPWLEGVRAGLAALIELFAEEPELTRTALVEVAGAGPEARRLHYAALERFAALLDRDRDRAHDGLPDQVSLMATGAVSGLIFDEVLAGRTRQLPAMEPDLLFALLVPYLGPRAAAGEMRRTPLRSAA